MPQNLQIPSPRHPDSDTRPPRRGLLAGLRRAVVEVAFIVFLFYSNLLMGEFNRVNSPGKTFAVALDDIFTIKNSPSPSSPHPSATSHSSTCAKTLSRPLKTGCPMFDAASPRRPWEHHSRAIGSSCLSS